MSAVEITEKVITDHGIPSDAIRKELQGQYGKRNFCVQYQESDLAFMSRLLEEEGIYFYFDHAKEADTLVLADVVAPGGRRGGGEVGGEVGDAGAGGIVACDWPFSGGGLEGADHRECECKRKYEQYGGSETREWRECPGNRAHECPGDRETMSARRLGR